MALPKQHSVQGTKALEIAMRDVMDSMEDSLSSLGFQPLSDCMEILSIEAPISDLSITSGQRAEVHDLLSHSASDMVSYLISREERLHPMRA